LSQSLGEIATNAGRLIEIELLTDAMPAEMANATGAG